MSIIGRFCYIVTMTYKNQHELLPTILLVESSLTCGRRRLSHQNATDMCIMSNRWIQQPWHSPYHHRTLRPRHLIQAQAVSRTKRVEQRADGVRAIRCERVQWHVPGVARASAAGGDLDVEAPPNLRGQDPGAALMVVWAVPLFGIVGQVAREYHACAGVWECLYYW